MALHAICPNCKSGFTLPDEVAGKKVRCNNCKVIFAAQDSKPNQRAKLEKAEPEEVVAVEAVEEAEEVEAVEAAPRKKPAPLRPAKPRAAAVEEVEEVEAVERPKARTALQKTSPTPASPKNGLTRDKTDPGARRSLAGRGARDDDYPTFANPPARSNVPLIVGTILGALVILVGGVVALALVLKGSLDSNAVAVAPGPPAIIIQAPQAPQPPAQIIIQPAPATPPPSVNPNPQDPKNGKITKDAKDAVKRATVYIEVVMADGQKMSGSGFFGCADAPKLVLTNAHVVGMLSPDSLKPQRVEVVINSGQPDEDRGQAQILGLDRSSDLCVLELFPETLKKKTPLPAPIPVKNAEALTELDEVYIFGFPLGKNLGSEITIRPSSVSSLRKIRGTNILDKIQVNGGMDPGNSGGPVVDNSGAVVGVAVSGIQGRMINFAIPGENVHTILNGRISEMGLEQSYYAPDQKVGVPVKVVLVDPRNLVKDVALEVWTGDAPAAGQKRTAGKSAPQPLPGDGPRQAFPLKSDGNARKGDIFLPPLPEGKTYWVQPVFTNGAGERHWVRADPYHLNTIPVERKPADLVFKPRSGVHKALVLTNKVTFKVGADEDSMIGRTETEVLFDSAVTAATQQGAAVSLSYRDVKKTLFEKVGDKGDASDFESYPSEMLKAIGPNYKRLRALETFDLTGNLVKVQLDGLAGIPKVGQQQLADFHKPISEALAGIAVPLPNKPGVAPMQSWKATRTFPIETPDQALMATYDLTFTYVGQRKRNGRDEAVISIAGELQQIDGKKMKVAATLGGTAVVDLANGETITAETNNVMDQSMKFPSRNGQVTLLTCRISTHTRVEYNPPKQ